MNCSEIEKGNYYWILKDGKAKQVKVEALEIKIGYYSAGWLQAEEHVKPEKLFKTRQDLIDSL